MAKNVVLIASADPGIREMGRLAAEADGLEPLLCGDGEEAFESARNGGLRLIVLEAFLPKLDGFDIIKKLQDQPDGAGRAPALLLIDPGAPAPSDPMARLKQSKVRFEADDYLQKPFPAAELQARIHSMTKHYRQHRAPHPVTGLPGHPELEQEVNARLAGGERFTLVCADINHFKPFNDHHGAEQGDAVIRKVADLIREIARSLRPSSGREPFLAHVDGDDFILLLPAESAAPARQELVRRFQPEAIKFYPPADGARGFFYGKDREDNQRIFPIMSLSTALVEVRLEGFAHYGELVSEMNERLHQSKII